MTGSGLLSAVFKSAVGCAGAVRAGDETISALADGAAMLAGCGCAVISVGGSGSITGALSVPDTGTRHSKASMRPVTGDEPAAGHRGHTVGGPRRIGGGVNGARGPFAGPAFVVALGAL